MQIYDPFLKFMWGTCVVDAISPNQELSSSDFILELKKVESACLWILIQFYSLKNTQTCFPIISGSCILKSWIKLHYIIIIYII